MITLYHGSNMTVAEPKILASHRQLDFGTAFYTTSDWEQAVKWAQYTTKRREEGKATVSVYELDETKLNTLNIKKFPLPNKAWLHDVAQNRTSKAIQDNIDLVIGPVADDQVIRTITQYIQGYFSEDVALQLLLPQRLKDQYAFKTSKALATLCFIKEVQV